MLFAYQISWGHDQDTRSSHKHPQVDFVPLQEKYAKDLPSEALLELKDEIRMVRVFESAILKSLIYYSTPDLEASDNNQDVADAALQNARGKFLSKCGKQVLRAVLPLVDAVAHSKKNNDRLEAGDREK